MSKQNFVMQSKFFLGADCIRRLRNISTILAVSFAVGCASTPYKDDYAKHVNLVGDMYQDDSAFAFSFDNVNNLELRGIYEVDDSVAESTIMYQGGAGLIGLFAQIGTHASIVNSSRNNKLAAQQTQANLQVSPLIEKAKSTILESLLTPELKQDLVNDDQQASLLKVKPIFFSNAAMDQVSLKLVAWIPNEKGRKHSLLYQNMIQIFGSTLTPQEQSRLLAIDDDFAQQTFATMLNTALNILKDDLSGQFRETPKMNKTFLVKQNNKNVVVRGTLIKQECDYQVIQNLHSWYVAFPKDNSSSDVTLNEQC